MDASHGCSRHRTSDVADGSHSPGIRIARGSKGAQPRERGGSAVFDGGGFEARTLVPAKGLHFTTPSVPSQNHGNQPVGQPPRSFGHGQPHASLFVVCSRGVYVAGFPRSHGVNAVEPGLHNAAGSLCRAAGRYIGPSVPVHDLNSPNGLRQIRLRQNFEDLLLQGISLLHPKNRIQKWFSRWSEISHVAGGFQHLPRNLVGVTSRLIAQAFRGISLQQLGVEVHVVCPLLDRDQQLCISDAGPCVGLRPPPDFVLVRDTKRDDHGQQGSDCGPSIPIDGAPLADYPALANPLPQRPQLVKPAHWRHPLSVSEPILT
ncbi:hypothetical protein NB706_000052 [Xanthomonas sacchari]|nr:hypothetical protein [Xanthomonas sacchari]